MYTLHIKSMPLTCKNPDVYVCESRKSNDPPSRPNFWPKMSNLFYKALQAERPRLQAADNVLEEKKKNEIYLQPETTFRTPLDTFGGLAEYA